VSIKESEGLCKDLNVCLADNLQKEIVALRSVVAYYEQLVSDLAKSGIFVCKYNEDKTSLNPEVETLEGESGCSLEMLDPVNTDECEHGVRLKDYCQPCGRTNTT